MTTFTDNKKLIVLSQLSTAVTSIKSWVTSQLAAQTITANVSNTSGDPITLTGTSGTNAVTYGATFAKNLGQGKGGNFGPSSDVTGTNDTTISVPYITVNDYGVITAIANKTYTSKDTIYTHPNTGFGSATTGTAATPAFGGNVDVVTGVTVNSEGHTTAIETTNITIPSAAVTASTSGQGGSNGLMIAADKEKLDGIAAGAQVNVLESITIANGSATAAGALTPTNKGVTITIPNNTSQLTNGANFQTGAEVQASIAAAIASLKSANFEVVDQLPAVAAAEDGVIYLVAHPGHNPATNDGYDEYVLISVTTPGANEDDDPVVTKQFEKIGNTDVNLSNYWTKDDFTFATDLEVEALFAEPAASEEPGE